MKNAQIAEYYDKFNSVLTQELKLKEPLARRVMIFRSFDILIKTLHNLFPDIVPHVLDIGCGVGVTSKYLAENGLKVTAVDISPKNIDFARNNMSHENIEYICSDIVQFRSRIKYEAILLCDVLEHIPLQRVSEVFKAIKAISFNETLIYLNIPDGRYLSFMRRYYPEMLQKIDEPWEIGDVINRFREIGFEVCFMAFRGIDVQLQYIEYLFCHKNIINLNYKEVMKPHAE